MIFKELVAFGDHVFKDVYRYYSEKKPSFLSGGEFHHDPALDQENGEVREDVFYTMDLSFDFHNSIRMRIRINYHNSSYHLEYYRQSEKKHQGITYDVFYEEPFTNYIPGKLFDRLEEVNPYSAIVGKILTSLNSHMDGRNGMAGIDQWQTDIQPPMGIKIAYTLKGDSAVTIKEGEIELIELQYEGYTGWFDTSGRCPSPGYLLFDKKRGMVFPLDGIAKWKAIAFITEDFS